MSNPRNFTRPFLLTIIGSSIGLWAPSARADDADKAACAQKDEGDACTRGDGDAGTCVPDDSDPVLTCEDSFGSGGDDSNDDGDDDSVSCSVAGGSTSGALALSLALLVGGVRRRRL